MCECSGYHDSNHSLFALFVLLDQSIIIVMIFMITTCFIVVVVVVTAVAVLIITVVRKPAKLPSNNNDIIVFRADSHFRTKFRRISALPPPPSFFVHFEHKVVIDHDIDALHSSLVGLHVCQKQVI